MEQETLDTTVASETPAPQEQMFNQIQVNDIVKREKDALAAKLRREIESERARMAQPSQPAPSADPESMYSQISDRVMSDLRNRYETEMRQKQEQEEIERNKQIAHNYFSKMSKGPEIYADFQEVMGDFRPEAFPEVAALAADMDNTADVMYELAKNPSKLVEINGIAKSDPNWAKKRLAALAGSIEANRQALQNAKNTNAPLSRLTPSNLGGMDAGPKSISDLRKLKWLKG